MTYRPGPGATQKELAGEFVSSAAVRNLIVADAQPTTAVDGTLWVPSTDWLLTHDHPPKAPALSVKVLSGNYFHPYISSAVTTDNLGAFSGALFQRQNMAPFYWAGPATAMQSFHFEVTTAGTGDLRFGLYTHDFDNGLPGTLVKDFGAVACTLGIKDVFTSYSLPARGWYWLAWVWQTTSTTGPVIRARQIEQPALITVAAGLNLSNRFGTAYPGGVAPPSGALPSLAGSTGMVTNSTLFPSVALRAA